MSLNINSFNSNSIGTLFSSLPYTRNSSFTGIENVLSDYSSLQSGSYNRLLKAYYSKVENPSADKTVKQKNKEVNSEFSALQKDAKGLLNATDKLLSKGTSSIWNKVEKKDATGKVSNDYDRNKIGSAISDFVDEYNRLVKEGQKTSHTGILTQIAGMTSIVGKSHSSLGQIGLSIDSNNYLSFDRNFFNEKADVSVAKSLFSGTGSLAYNVATKASMVNSYAGTKLSDISGKRFYSNSGNYSISSADILSSLNQTI